jgi:gliding motility-associated-like protein
MKQLNSTKLSQLHNFLQHHLWSALLLILILTSHESKSQTLCNPPIPVNAGVDASIPCGGNMQLGEPTTPSTPDYTLSPTCKHTARFQNNSLTQGGGIYINDVTTTNGTVNINNTNTLVDVGHVDPMGPNAWSTIWLSDYSATHFVEACPGNTFNLNINARSLYNNVSYFCRVWVDWDNNGSFTASEVVYTSSAINTHPNINITNISITVPAGQSDGAYRMRIRFKDNAPFVASDGACTYTNSQGIIAPYGGYTGNQTGSYTFSDEIEDYAVHVNCGNNSEGNYTYSWSPPNGLSSTTVSNPTATPSQTTTYTVTVTDNINNCITTDQVTVTVNTSTPTFTNPGPVCQGSSFTLPATSIEGITGTWSPAVNTTATTIYTFTPSAGQCTTVTQMTVVVNTELTPVFTNPGPICPGTSFTLPTTSNNGITGTWSPAIDNTTTTTYTFTPDNTGCTSSVTMTVVIDNQIIPAFTNPGPICEGTAFTLPTTSNNGVAGTWSPVIDNTTTTTYTFTPNNTGCASATTMTVIVNPGFEIAVSDNIQLCPGENIPPVVITAIGGIAPYTFVYSVDNGLPDTITSGQPTATIDLASYPGLNLNTSGCHSITISGNSPGFCPTGNSVFTDYICVYPSPQASFSVAAGNTGNYSFTNTSSSAIGYEWDFGDHSPIEYTEDATHHYPNENASGYTIELIAYNEAGCSDTAYQVITIEEDLIFYVPNTFTPDGDEYNNVFSPVMTSGYDPSNYQLEIYNRWGECIFTSNHSAIGWDGTYKGEMTQDGMYTWKLKFKITSNDDKKEYVGHVNIIR